MSFGHKNAEIISQSKNKGGDHQVKKVEPDIENSNNTDRPYPAYKKRNEGHDSQFDSAESGQQQTKNKDG